MALNAGAPTFIPSFGVQDGTSNNKNNTTHESSTALSPLSSSTPDKATETTTNKNQRQTSKGTKQQRSRTHPRRKNNHGSDQKHQKSQQDQQGEQDTKKNENQTKQSSQPRKKNQSQQSQNNNNKNNNNNRQRQRQRRRRKNHKRGDQQEHNTTHRHGSSDQTVDRHHREEESAFPPLLHEDDAVPQVDGKATERDRNHDHWSSIAWNGHQTSLIQEDKMEAERQQQIFSQSSLSMTLLTNHALHATTTTADNNNTNSLDVWNTSTSRMDDSVNQKELALVEADREPALASTTTTTTPIKSRKRFDMAKLRGRWWNLLKSQRQKEEELEAKTRQAEKHKQAIVMDDDDGESVSSSSSSLSSSLSSSSSSLCSSSSDNDSDDTNSFPSDRQEDTSKGTKFDKYLNSEYPLHQAILEEDLSSIEALLSWDDPRRIRANVFASRSALGLVEAEQDDNGTATKLHSAGATFSPLQLAVYLDRPHLIRPLLGGMPSSSTSSSPSPTVVDIQNRTPLMLAAELGLDGCIKLLLLHQHDATLTAKDNQNGNTALHYACRAGAPASTLRLVLLGGGGNNKKNAMQQQRILLPLKNHRGQTPLHVACEHGHVHLVEVFLSTCSASLLSKVLRMQDNLHQTPLLTAIGAGSIDTVMSILMWRGNHHQPPQQTTQVKPSSSSTTATTPCPLTWAICKGNIEMIHLLLEFNHPVTPYKSDGSYYLVDALYMAVNLDDDADVENPTPTNSDNSDRNAFETMSSTKLEIIQILVNAGANPCAKVEGNDPNVAPSTTGGGNLSASSAAETTPVSAAAAKGDVQSIKVMLDMFQRVKEQNTIARRQDPKLQKQPETYFGAIEAREQHEVDTAVCDALVKSLFTSWKTNDDFKLQKQCLEVAVALLHRGAKLNQAGFARLKDSIAFNRLKSPMEQFTMTEGLYRFETTYYHYSEPNALGSVSKKLSTFDRSALNFWSKRLCAMPWMKQGDLHLQCSWMKGEFIVPKEHLSEDDDSSLASLGDVILLAEDERFRVHSELISAKSAKLAAAVRFQMMNQESDDDHPNDSPIELKIELSSKMCKYLLQHIYHGSIFCGWPATSIKSDICGEILEMALVAEEYLVPSLKHECEMRLLSAHPKRCYCWSCCTVVRSCCCTTDVENDNSTRDVVMDPQSMPVYECLYRIDGPSRLLDESSVLDALAVSQQFQEFRNGKGLKFWSLLNIPVNSVFSDKTVWENHRKNKNCLSVDFEGVKHAAIEVFFNSFCAVIQSPSYSLQMQATFEENDTNFQCSDQENEMQIMLLQACLDELSDSTMVCTSNSKYRSKIEQSSRIDEALTKS